MLRANTKHIEPSGKEPGHSCMQSLEPLVNQKVNQKQTKHLFTRTIPSFMPYLSSISPP